MSQTFVHACIYRLLRNSGVKSHHPHWNRDSWNQSCNCSWVTVVLDHRAPNASRLRHWSGGRL